MTLEEVTDWFKPRDPDINFKQHDGETDIYFKKEITCCTISGSLDKLSEEMLLLILREVKLWASKPRAKEQPKNFKDTMSENSKFKNKRAKKQAETDKFGKSYKKKKR
jgi:hypothetical protein